MLTALSVGTGGLGRFGNQCWTIAGVIGIAVKSGQPYGFPEWINRDNANFGGIADSMDRHLVTPLPRYIENIYYRDYGYFWGYKDVTLPTGNWSIDAHLQSPRFFEHCLPLIRETFRMKDEPNQSEAVAVHFRGGDYIDDATAYHPRCSLEYYEQAMAQFPVGTQFWLFSDDQAAAKERLLPLVERYDIVAVDSGDYITDFKRMKQCRSFITANSSFSAFAAILGEHPDKKIIMPRRWFGPVANLDFQGYPEGAIIL